MILSLHTRTTRLLLASAALLAAPAALRAQDDGHGAHSHAPVLGSVTFANSGAAAAQEPFLRGIALTHSFEYSEAVRAFREAMAADPSFALPYWAEALTYSHVVWGEENLEGGRAALARLAPTPEARLARARTPNERAFAAAVEALFAEGDQAARVRGFADGMRAWSARMPEDPEAHAFTALAAMVQSFVTRDEALAAQIGAEAAMHAQRVLDGNPRHPGAAHYMIHANDSPALAQQGLAAARAYAAIAPDAQHALHMPSHIFLPLGMWDDMLASNQRSWAVARQEAIRAGSPGWYTDFHSLNWMQYAYLQQGRWAEARALVDSARALTAEPIRTPASGYVDASYALEQLAFRYAVETGRWDVWPADSVGMNWRDPALSQRARGMSSASAYQRAVAAMRMRGDTLPAVAAARAFREAAAAGPPNPALERFAAQLDALVLQARGDDAGYVAALQAQLAANRVPRRRSMTPQTTLVVSEELGAALLKAGRAAEAAAAYEQALEDRPNRAAALLGLARARAAAGDAAGARKAYGRLAAVWARADAGLPDLAEVRRAQPVPVGN
jgi:tetratricopeptide (TPR) repeat protein